LYLIDTNVVSEARKGARANPGVTRFFQDVTADSAPVYLSAVTVGELRRGVALVRRRGDTAQAEMLGVWLDGLLGEFAESILPFDADAAQIWGVLRMPDPAHELDKQIAATALSYGLTVVTRNVADFAGTGAKLRNPFLPAGAG
jgi:predicted nucleic acid-binding protein